MKLLNAITRKVFLILALTSTGFINSASTSDDHDHGHEEEHSDGTEISSYYIQVSGIKSEAANSQSLVQVDTLFGVISPVQDQVFSLHAAFPSMVEKVYVQIGDQVKKEL